MLLEGIYILAKILVLYLRRIYYKDPVVLNPRFAEIKHPTLLISNHPNTLMDAIFAAATVSAQVNFLANYSLFKSRFGHWFFSTFYCIPVQRPEDVIDGKTDNTASLAKSYEHLANGGSIYIAAEGYSIRTIGLRPLKTGAARIGLNTEAEFNWDTKVQLLPIGLNYNAGDRFRSNLVIHVGKPFDLKAWKYDFERDPRETVQKVTEYLSNQLKSVLLHDDDPELLSLLEKIRAYKAHTLPTDPKREYLRTRKDLFELQSKSDEAIQNWKLLVANFEHSCKAADINPEHVAQAYYDDSQPIQLSGLVWSLPITIFGFLTNFLPYLICHSIEKKFNKLLVYRATFRLVPAMVFFPLMYLFWMWLVSWMTDSVILTLASLLVYRRSGIFAWHQIKDWSRYFRSRKILDKHSPLVLQMSALIEALKTQKL